MMILYSKIINGLIVEAKTQTKVGSVYDIVINRNDLTVEGILIKNSAFSFKKQQVVSVNDLMAIDGGDISVLINSEDSVINLDEVVRTKKDVDEGFVGVDQTVITKSGKRIGKVFDLLIDSETLTIKKLYIKNILGERIIPTSSVVSMEPKRKIIVKDDLATVQITSPVVENSLV